MKSSDTLFRLIKSLNTAEKSHFKKQFTSKSQESASKQAYIKLFDTMDNMVEYNKPEILKKIKDKKIIERYSDAKNSLYTNILQFLYEFHPVNNFTRKVYEQIEKANILFHREQFDECEDLLEKAHKTARHYELHLYLLEINELRAQLQFKKENKKAKEEIDLLFEQQHSIIHQYQNLADYQKLHFRVIDTLKKGQVDRKGKENKELKKLFDSPLLKEITNARTVKAQYLFLNTHASYNNYIAKLEEQYKYLHALVMLLNHTPQVAQTTPMRTLYAYTRYLTMSMVLNKYENFQNILDKFLSIEFPSLFFETLYKYEQASIKMRILLTRGDIQLAFSQIKKFESDLCPILNNVDYYPSQYKLWQFNCMLVCFFNKSYKDVNVYLNNILNYVGSSSEIDYITLPCRLIKLIIFFEQKDFNTLDDLIRSTRLYLKRHNQLLEFEEAITNHLKILIYENNQKTIKEHFQKLKAYLESSFTIGHITNIIGFNPYLWIDSKIEDKSIEKLIKEYAEKESPAISGIKLKL